MRDQARRAHLVELLALRFGHAANLLDHRPESRLCPQSPERRLVVEMQAKGRHVAHCEGLFERAQRLVVFTIDVRRRRVFVVDISFWDG